MQTEVSTASLLPSNPVMMYNESHQRNSLK